MEAIQYKRHNEIDKTKWDKLIQESPNGFIYSRSFFLDAMCTWDALVMGDYDYVMPLPYKKKAGFSYIYTPYFTGQLGITGKGGITKELCEKFMTSIPGTFSLVDLQLNEYNSLPDINNIRIKARTNYTLALNKSYNDIFPGYNKDAKKNLRQAAGHGLSFTENITAETVWELYKNAYGHLNRDITGKEYADFFNACTGLLQLDHGFLAGIQDNAGEIVAGAFFAKDNKRIYYLLGAPSVAGKKANATHLLIDEVIKKYAGSGLTFDFEGSDIPSVADFYKKFGPKKNVYLHVILNRLPFWIKWLKKT